jgi:hypothetical protein
MLILAWLTAGGDFKQTGILDVAFRCPWTWTAGMTCGHDVMVGGHLLSHSARRMHVPGLHGQHRRYGHLCPSHHDHKQRRRNGLLHHAAVSVAD